MSNQEDDIRAIKQALFGYPYGSGGLVREVKEARQECKLGIEQLRDENAAEHKSDRASIRNLIFAILTSGVAVVIAQVLTR